MSDKKTDTIEPADFNLDGSPLFSPQTQGTARARPSLLVWISLAFLLLLALAVIFVLPGIVSRYELPLEPRISVAETTPTIPNSAPSPLNSVSPFDEAQRSLQRKDAQDRLAELLAAQATLTVGQVELWGNEKYQLALEKAAFGDQAYLAQNFIDARDNYHAGFQLMDQLVNSIPAELARFLAEGEDALVQNDGVTALDRFTVALALEPGNQQAVNGAARARTLDQVNGLVRQAAAARDRGDLELARENFERAALLDDQHDPARQGLADVERQIQEARFAGLMSSGYAHLQNDQPQQAIEAFERAAAMGVNREQAQAAIDQTRDELARVIIEGHRSAALAAEQSERWQDAVSAYDQALTIDPNLLFALSGRDYAQKRARLDQLLQAAIANPERLGEAEVYEESLDVFYTGRAIEPAGPQLASQLDQLELLLEQSQIPVDVQLRSDNATSVTLLRVAELGPFENRSLTLKPGRYVAVGTRAGYRDVRQEFVVGFGQTPEQIVIQCEEVVVGSRGP